MKIFRLLIALLCGVSAFHAVAQSAAGLKQWHDGGQVGTRPPGRLLPATLDGVSRAQRLWAVPLYRALYDPDGRAWRDKLRRRT